LYKKDEIVSVLTTFVCKGHLIKFKHQWQPIDL